MRELTDVERQQVLLSEEFQRFFDKSGRIMERALADNKDILADMLGEGEDDEGYGLIVFLSWQLSMGGKSTARGH